jgi:hypothetical protein
MMIPLGRCLMVVRKGGVSFMERLFYSGPCRAYLIFCSFDIARGNQGGVPRLTQSSRDFDISCHDISGIILMGINWIVLASWIWYNVI